jgi:hypothetical protein
MLKLKLLRGVELKKEGRKKLREFDCRREPYVVGLLHSSEAQGVGSGPKTGIWHLQDFTFTWAYL